MRLFRLFKITKILRTIRIIKVFRELSMMVESFTKCIVAMFWGLVLPLGAFREPKNDDTTWKKHEFRPFSPLLSLFFSKRLVFLLYIFALVFVQGITDLLRNTQLTETGQQEVEAQFGSVLKSMPLVFVPETPLKRLETPFK